MGSPSHGGSGLKTVRLILSAVGRAKPGPEKDLFGHYARRLTWPLHLREVEEKKAGLPVPERIRREGRLLLDTVPDGAAVIVLDEQGKNLTSEVFAARLGEWRDQGRPACAFLIGGADGHAEEVIARADLLLSLGALTWPHMLARIMMLEQVYRARQILVGHPYHREG